MIVNEKEVKIIAIDFDGTLCNECFPYIGAPRMDIINKCIELKSRGIKLILNTCRKDVYLKAAIDWCRGYGLEFDAANENLQCQIDVYGDCRKIGSDLFLDDKNISFENFLSL